MSFQNGLGCSQNIPCEKRTGSPCPWVMCGWTTSESLAPVPDAKHKTPKPQTIKCWARYLATVGILKVHLMVAQDTQGKEQVFRFKLNSEHHYHSAFTWSQTVNKEEKASYSLFKDTFIRGVIGPPSPISVSWPKGLLNNVTEHPNEVNILALVHTPCSQ